MSSTCKSCRFWDPDTKNKANMGECRRSAPLYSYVDQGQYKRALWLATYEFDWCGEFEEVSDGRFEQHGGDASEA